MGSFVHPPASRQGEVRMESITISHLKRRAIRARQASVRTVEQRLRYVSRTAWAFDTPCQFFRRLGREVSLHHRLLKAQHRLQGIPYLLRQLAMPHNDPIRLWRPCSEPLSPLLRQAPPPQIFDRLSHKERLLLILCQRRLSRCSRASRLSDIPRSALALPIRRLRKPYSTRQRRVQRFTGSAACMFYSLRKKWRGRMVCQGTAQAVIEMLWQAWQTRRLSLGQTDVCVRRTNGRPIYQLQPLQHS
jgi:hypothetical protein